MEIKSLNLRETISYTSGKGIEATVNGESVRIDEELGQDLDIIEKRLKRLLGEDKTQEELDRQLKSIENVKDYSELSSCSTGLSLAFKKASGFNYSGRLPLPISPIIGGQNNSFQQFIVLPICAEDFREAVDINSKIYRDFKERYSRKVTGHNIRGEMLVSMDDQKIGRSLRKVAEDYGAKIGINFGANSYYKNNSYNPGFSARDLSLKEYIKSVQSIIRDLDPAFIEDPFHNESMGKHALISSKNPDRIVSGGDLFGSNKSRLDQGIENGACNCITSKYSDSGAVTSFKQIHETAEEAGYLNVSDPWSAPESVKLALEIGIPAVKLNIAGPGSLTTDTVIEIWDRLEEPGLNSRLTGEF